MNIYSRVLGFVLAVLMYVVLSMSQALAVTTTTTVVANNTPSNFQVPNTFTATVVAGGGEQVSGNVSFNAVSVPGGTAIFLGTEPVNPATGQAILQNYCCLSAGTYSVTATYLGFGGIPDPFLTSTSAPVNQVVVAPLSPTTTTVTSSPNPSNVAQLVTLTASVTSAGGTPVGSVQFFDDGVLIGTGPVNGSGTATLTTTALAAGSNLITATFVPSTAAFATSTSSFSLHTVRLPTAVTIVSSPNPSIVGAPVTLNATVVVTSGTGTPVGSVEFFDDGVSLGTATLNGSGIATLPTSALALGNNNIDAVYTPSLSIFQPAALAALHLHVVNAATNTDSAKLDDIQEAATGVAASLASESITDSVGEEIGAALSGQVQVMSASDGKIGFVYSPGMGKGSIITPTADVASGENEVASWRIWTSLRYTDFDSSDLEGDQVNALIGTTFLFGDGLVAGLVAGYEDQDYKNDIGATLKGEGFNVGGYFGGALDGGLRFDAQVHASFLDYDLAAGAATGSTDGTRLIVGGGIAHSLQVGALTIDPTARFSGTWEWQDGYTDSLAVIHDDRKFNFGRASVGAKAAYRIDMADGARLSPFVTAFGDYRFSGGDVVGEGLMDGMSARVGLGFDLRASNGITASALAEFYGLGLDDNASAKSFKAQVAIPF